MTKRNEDAQNGVQKRLTALRTAHNKNRKTVQKHLRAPAEKEGEAERKTVSNEPEESVARGQGLGGDM